MRKSALILAIAPLIFALNACNEPSKDPKTPTTPGSNSTSPVNRNRWETVKNRGRIDLRCEWRSSRF